MIKQITTAAARFLSFRDLQGYTRADVRQDILSALVVTIMGVPQGVAYAVIAGLPPVAGLYASVLPTIIGSLFRSSRHVVTGPTNAVSLLVGGGIAAMTGHDPMTIAVTLAVLVGIFQFTAGVFRLGALVDFISNPVVLGYITGAGLLIGIGQLPNVTATSGVGGDVFQKLWGWAQGLDDISILAVSIAVGTAVLILALRKVSKKIPAEMVAMSIAILLSWALDLHGYGMLIVSDLTPVPSGLPPLTVPEWSLMGTLVPLAVAAAVLSLVESSALSRSIAAQTGQKLDTSAEFAGQGLANIASGFTGGYPTSGSLSRSAVNHSSGARSRLSGAMAGTFMLGVLLVAGPIINYTPIAALAGLLVVVAIGLVNVKRIKLTMSSPWSDRFAFVGTLLGTWFLPLDQAIYLGVGISLVLFLRKARFLVIRELAITDDGSLQEVNDEENQCRQCEPIRILNIEGHLFFGVVGELQSELDNYTLDPDVKVLILRLKRTRGIDVTVATALETAALRMEESGRYLLLAGVRADVLKVLKQTRVIESIGGTSVFPSRDRWFASLTEAVEYADELVEHHDRCEECPLRKLGAPSAYPDTHQDPAESSVDMKNVAHHATSGDTL